MANADFLDLNEPITPRARGVLARRLADIVGLPSSRLTPRERWIVGDLLHDILKASDVELRKRCAQRLAGLNDAPGKLLRTLACDVYEVAEPILEECKALNDFDMLEIARVGSLQHHIALARRNGISETVAAALTAYGQPPVVERLLKNKTAHLAAPTIDHLVGAAAEQPRYAALLIKRDELRPAPAFRMFWGCEHVLRLQILERFAVDRTILIDAAEDVFPMAAAEGWADPLVTRALNYIDRRQRNRKAEATSQHGSLEAAIEAMRVEGARAELISEIATLAGINRSLVIQMFEDLGGESLAVLCKATGLKWAAFDGMWSGLGRSTGVEIAVQARRVYDSLSVEKSQTVLRYWNLSMVDNAKSQG
jgi:uncharacterized protein (DUF2336 family)